MSCRFISTRPAGTAETGDAREQEALLDKCKADQAEYLDHPKPPVLKSCLSYETQLRDGVKDEAMLNQCSTDLIEELPSCGEWKRVAEGQIEEAKLRASRPRPVVCSTFGNPTVCN